MKREFQWMIYRITEGTDGTEGTHIFEYQRGAIVVYYSVVRAFPYILLEIVVTPTM